jgi:peroxiredoxin
VTRAENLYELPAGLPVPEDDGAAEHLPGLELPPVSLASTSGENVDLSALAGRTVLYCYPMTGRPDRALPAGWDGIPGARGCTPQSCAFRDHHAELGALGARVFGLSTQSTGYQREAKERLHLPFELLSDQELRFAGALGLPTFEVEGTVLLKRLTMIVSDGRIEKVFYPVFPPDKNAGEVAAWLARNPAGRL